MSYTLLANISKFIGASTDTKPSSGVRIGSEFYESDYLWEWIWNGYAWVPKKIALDNITVNYKQISLNQAASTYDVMTATTQNLFIDAVIVNIPDDLSAVAGFTGISIQTDDGSPIVLFSSTLGAKSNLTGNYYNVYRGPAVTAATKKIQLTIIGATAGSGAEANITVIWRPVVAGGYYLNA